MLGLFLDPFLLKLWRSLGASWESSWASWGSLGSLWIPKTLKNQWLFKVFGIAEFWICEPLDGSLGLVLTLLGPIWSQNGTQNGPKSGPTSDQKVIQKMIPNFTKNKQFLVPKMGSKMVRNGEPPAQRFLSGGISKALGSKICPRYFKMDSNSPR